MPPKPERKCLIILGMHRSGTSALTGAFHLAGLDVGKTLMKTHPDNPKGYFENDALFMFNEQLFNDLYSKWYDTLLIPDKWWESRNFDNRKSQLSGILSKEYSEDGDLIIKDPRISVLLPLYIEVLRKDQILPVFLISHRNPLEISLSLSRRDNLPQERNLLVTTDYLLKTEYYSRGFPRLLVSYNAFLEEPLALMQMTAKELGLNLALDEQIRSKIMAYLDKDLKHHHRKDLAMDGQELTELKELSHIWDGSDRRDFTEKEVEAMDGIRERLYRKVQVYQGIPGRYKSCFIIFNDQGDSKTYDFDIDYGLNRLHLSLEGEENIQKVIIKPASTAVGMQILSVKAATEEDGLFDVQMTNSNAPYVSRDGIWIFESEIPQAQIDFDPHRKLKELALEVNYLAFGAKAIRMLSVYRGKLAANLSQALDKEREKKAPASKRLIALFDERNRLAEELQRIEGEWKKLLEVVQGLEMEKQLLAGEKDRIKQELEQKLATLRENEAMIRLLNKEIQSNARRIANLENELQTVYGSITWKAGRWLTAPLRWGYNLFKKNG